MGIVAAARARASARASSGSPRVGEVAAEGQDVRLLGHLGEEGPEGRPVARSARNADRPPRRCEPCQESWSWTSINPGAAGGSGDPPHNRLARRLPMMVIPEEELAMALAPTQSLVETPSRAFYRQAMEVLTRAQVPFLVGGAFAFVHQAGIDRSTKDLDIFVAPGRRAPPARGVRRRRVRGRAGVLPLAGEDPLARGVHRRDLQLGQRPRRRGRPVVRARRPSRTFSA